MSDLLVARQGPLAHVWLASNYDKKLSKQQFLNTDLITSSNLISTRQVQANSTSASASAGGNSADTITLRLSGQLLLGIVRIYSRKTKYLLDDIHETLHKLKTSFKYASGASLASAAASGASAINLPPQRTTVANLARITLQDQISGHDLFYQDDLILDDASDKIAEAVAQFPQNAADQELGEVGAADRSVEVGRDAVGADFDADMGADLDLDLDFDLDMDNSIEMGRDAQAALPDVDQSIMDIQGKEGESEHPELASGLPDVTFDLDLDTAAAAENQDAELPEIDSDGPHEAQTPPAREPRRLVGISDSGVVRTTKRKLVVDSQADLERGITNDVLRSIQQMQTNGRFSEETLTLRLTEQEKLDLISELAAPIQSKKRKVWNLDEQLRQRCLELQTEEAQDDEAAAGDYTGDFSGDFSGDMDLDMDTNMDLDISLPGLDSDDNTDAAQLRVESENEGEDDESDTGLENLKSTSQVAEHLREFFYEKPAVTLQELMDRDTAGDVEAPLGITRKSGAGPFRVSDRREATKCFFELLVLATNDCVSLEQESPARGTEIPADLRVRPRDNLVSKFL